MAGKKWRTDAVAPVTAVKNCPFVRRLPFW